MTKKEMFVALSQLNEVRANTELLERVEHELALLENRKANVNRKPTKKQLENNALMNAIVAEMEPGVAYTNREMLQSLACCGNMSSQKLNALLSQLVASNRVERKVEKRVARFTVLNDEWM